MDNCSLLELRLFRTAAQKGSVSYAAKVHHLSQSAASSAIMRLEKAVGLALITHEKNRFQLTPSGYQFLARLDDLETWLEGVKAMKKNPEKGPWRLALSHSLAVALFPLLFAHLRRVWPNLVLEPRIGNPEAVAGWIQEGEVDIGIMIEPNFPLSCVKFPLFSGTFHLYSVSSVQEGVLIDSSRPQARQFKDQYEQLYKRNLPVIFDVPSWEVIAAMTDAGFGMGFLPSVIELSHPRLTRVEMPLEPIPYQVLAVTRLPDHLSGLGPILQEIQNALIQ